MGHPVYTYLHLYLDEKKWANHYILSEAQLFWHAKRYGAHCLKTHSALEKYEKMSFRMALHNNSKAKINLFQSFYFHSTRSFQSQNV